MSNKIQVIKPQGANTPLQDLAQQFAEACLKMKVNFPAGMTEGERQAVMCLGYLRATVIASSFIGFTREDMIASFNKEWDILEAAQTKVGKG
jgi:hypothetical protein